MAKNFDLEKMQMMISRRQAPNKDREMLAASHLKRRKHKPGKAHATNKERSKQAQTKKRRLDHFAKIKAKGRETYQKAVRAFWDGLSKEHP